MSAHAFAPGREPGRCARCGCAAAGAVHGGAGGMITCDVDDRPAVARIRWTVYGGAYKYAYVCEKHRAYTEGNRGVDVLERLHDGERDVTGG